MLVAAEELVNYLTQIYWILVFMEFLHKNPLKLIIV